MISLAGKAALITGGSRGIGAAAVKLFAQAGADVVFNYNKAKDAAEQVQQEAGKHGTRVEAFKADVGRHADNKKLVEFAISRLGRLDIVVANAGIWNLEDLPIEKMTEKQWDDMIRVNLKSVYSIIHFSVPQMIKQKSGKIIPISSTAGQRGESFHTHYGASKGGIISFAKGLATELARHNILVNCVAPGWVATDMSNPVINSKTGGKAIASAIPLRRAGTAEEIAGPILFLASDLANFMTALGGPTYLDIRESNCEGRLAQFGHSGELTGYTPFKVYWRYPDKNRTDFSKKGVIVNVYNGDRGWTLDRGGVSELSNAAVADFQEQAKRDINNLLRMRLKEPGMTIRFGGTDVVDLRTVDWVEITDTEQRDFRLAVDRSTHFLVRTVVTLADDTSPTAALKRISTRIINS